MSTSSPIPRTRRAPAARLPRVVDTLRDRWQWLPLVIAFVYFVGLFANFGSILHSIYDLSDWSSVLNFGQDLPSAPHSATATFNDVFVVSVIGFELATHWLPDHRLIWELGPWLAGVIASGLLAWVVSRIVGKWASMIVFVTLVCAGPILLQLQFEWDGHAATYQGACLLGAIAALLPLGRGMLGRSTWVWCIGLAVTTLLAAAALTDDQLFALAGLVPFVLTCIVTAVLSTGVARRRLVLSAGVITVGALVLSVIGKHLAENHGLRLTSNSIYVVPYNQILDHVGLLAQSLLQLLNGDFGSQALNANGALAFAGAAAIAVLLYVAYRRGADQARELIAGWMERQPQRDARDVAQVALVVYWSLSAIVVALAFVFTTAPADIGGRRYVITIAYAIAVLAAVAAAPKRWSRNLVAAAVSIIIAGATVAMFEHKVQNNLASFPTPSDAAQLERWAKSQHLKYGYASYWDAAPLSWWTQEHPAVYSTTACGTGSAQTLCPYAQIITSWYKPRPHTRTFVVVDNRFLTENPANAEGVTGPPPALGRPSKVAHVGVMTVYVYPYDVAERFGPAG
jgi:hypothetical protein